jgi:hypothetical protein
VALKVTEVPEQMVVAEAAMLTLAVREEFTVMVMPFEVAGFPEMQEALEVNSQVMTSLLESELFE